MSTLAKCANIAFIFLRQSAPVDTGKLKKNAIIIRHTGPDEYQITIDSSIAPYAVYTNEKWVAASWNGKQNPNEKWIDEAVKSIAEMLAEFLGGSLSYIPSHEDNRWENKKYWDAVQIGEIKRNDNIISIDGAVRENTKQTGFLSRWFHR